MTSKNKAMVVIITAGFIIGNVFAISYLVSLEPLQSCSRVPGQEISCPEGFVCYEELTGGLGPSGPLPIESMGGDKLCHKECETNNDCSESTPICLWKRRTTEDYSVRLKLCFSEK